MSFRRPAQGSPIVSRVNLSDEPPMRIAGATFLHPLRRGVQRLPVVSNFCGVALPARYTFTSADSGGARGGGGGATRTGGGAGRTVVRGRGELGAAAGGGGRLPWSCASTSLDVAPRVRTLSGSP